MGNKSGKNKSGAKPTPYTLKIEFFGDRVVAGHQIRGQAVLTLDDIYKSKAGLDKAVVSFSGYESACYAEQKSSNEPKKAKSRIFTREQTPVFSSQLSFHDFQGCKELNGGRYILPFAVPVPRDLPPTIEVSPVEMSMLDVNYFI